MKIAIIGAGPSGITAAKNLLDKGFTDLTVFERNSEVGGNWVFNAETGHSSVFETTHIISSKKYSQFEDMPMPDHYPDYPSHKLLAAYFQNYAAKFGLYDFIRFQTAVEKCEPEADGRWRVIARNEKTGEQTSEFYDFLTVANGHHWKPRYPEYPGVFTGELIHSHDFKRAAPFAGKRVLIIGGGNSACDCAVETSRLSEYTDISMRRGYWIVPKFILGVPVDHIHNFTAKYFSWLPMSMQFANFERLVRWHNGSFESYGMQKPDHRVLQTHPTLNTELVYFIKHGEIGVKPDILRLDGQTVHFKDGTSRDYDAIIACTGFWISHPFIDKSLLDFSQGKPRIYLKMLPANVKNIAYIGLFQPLGCIWPAAELQSKILARMLKGEWRPPKNLAKAIDAELSHPDVEQIKTARHTITVDYPKFRKRLLRNLPPDYVSREPVTTRHARAAE
ncbi:MAG: NAD(P)-binding domain-containing protein [Rhodomicrobium sp.]